MNYFSTFGLIFIFTRVNQNNKQNPGDVVQLYNYPLKLNLILDL